MDLVCGFDAQRNSIRVQAQRLLCIAGLSSDGIREWHAAGPKFVSRHSVSCGRRKNCCSPHHLSPGNQKDNWDDMKKVRTAGTLLDLNCCRFHHFKYGSLRNMKIAAARPDFSLNCAGRCTLQRPALLRRRARSTSAHDQAIQWQQAARSEAIRPSSAVRWTPSLYFGWHAGPVRQVFWN